MSHKQMPRLGSAIASTILSVFGAVSLVGVDKAQAALLSYNFHEKTYGYNGFFTVDNSSLTGIGVEYVLVSEGIFNGFPAVWPGLYLDNYNYNNLAERASAVFYQGAFRGLQAADSVNGFRGYYYYPNEIPGLPYGQYSEARISAYWEITTRQSDDPSIWTSRIWGYSEYRSETDRVIEQTQGSKEVYVSRQEINDGEVYYTLVPEPLTAGGTALALAGLTWLKHKKKRAA